MSATLVARGLAAGHGARSLFADLDLVVGPGDVVGLVGANGAGKSTLLRLLGGLVEPEQGDVGRRVGRPQQLQRRHRAQQVTESRQGSQDDHLHRSTPAR